MNRHHLRELQDVHTYPCLTITMPTHRTAPDNRQDPIRVKNLVNEATNRLLGEFSKREVAPLLERLEALVAAIDYRHTLDGLVLAVNRDMAREYVLPFELTERVVVDDSFFIRDLVHAYNRTRRYWVLSLSEQLTRLYLGTREHLEEVTAAGFPHADDRPGRRRAAAGRTWGQQVALSGRSSPAVLSRSRSGAQPVHHRGSVAAGARRRRSASGVLPRGLVAQRRDPRNARRQLRPSDGARYREDHLATGEGGFHRPPQGGARSAGDRGRPASGRVDARRGLAPRSTWKRRAPDCRGGVRTKPARITDTGLLDLQVGDPKAPDVLDDAVDEVITTVLTKGGRVVFVERW